MKHASSWHRVRMIILCLVISVIGLSRIDGQSTTSPSTAQLQEWKGMLDRLGMMPAPYHPETKSDKAFINKFMTIDTNGIPDEYRYEFLNERLYWDQITGNWNGMLAIRDSLMRKDRKPNEHLLDADLLYKIGSYFSTVVFFPPNDDLTSRSTPTTKAQWAVRTAYWEKHYRNFAEAARIYQYIVDHFDNNYVTTVKALGELAANQDDDDLSFSNHKKFAAFDVSKLRGTSRFDPMRRKIVPAEEGLAKKKADLENDKRFAFNHMTECAARMKPDMAIARLGEAKAAFPGNADFQKSADAGLTRARERKAMLEGTRKP